MDKKQAFIRLMSLLDDRRIYGQYYKVLWYRECYRSLCSEVEELGEAIDSGKDRHIASELGDILVSYMDLVDKLGDRAGVFHEEIISSLIGKLERRMPHLVEKRQITREEEGRLWEEWKEKEREEKGYN